MHLLPPFYSKMFLVSLGVNTSIFLGLYIAYIKGSSYVQILLNYLYIFVTNIRKKYTKNDHCDGILFFLFFFVAIVNYSTILGLFPIFSMFQLSFLLIFISFILMIFKAFKSEGPKILLSFVPKSVPTGLKPLIYFFELLSFLTKPIIFTLRLIITTAVGHLLIDVLKIILPNWFAFELGVAFLKIVEILTSSLQVYLLLNVTSYLYGNLVNEHH